MNSHLSRSESIEVVFDAQLKLTREEIEEAGGDLAQAVQNQIGHTGAQVIEIDDLRSDMP